MLTWIQIGALVAIMADRFDKFTERARRVLTLAQEEAQRFNHNYIALALLLAWCEKGMGSSQVLNNLGVELPRSVPPSSSSSVVAKGAAGEIGLTPRPRRS